MPVPEAGEKVVKPKTSRRKALEQVAKSTGIKPPELEGIQDGPPETLQHLYDYYEKELSWSTPLSYQELHAWMRVTNRRLSPAEAEVLMTLDRIFRSCQTKSHH